jgi:hypothetical protein
MADPNSQTDGNGVMTDDEAADPSDNVNAPDPLLNETPRSGALAAVSTPANPQPAAGSKQDQQARVAKNRSAMDTLQDQYGLVSQNLSGA